MKLQLTLFWCILLGSAMAQSNQKESANTVLSKVKSKLESIGQLSYRQTRETRYYADNYSNLFTADMYIDFTAKGPLKFWFQATDSRSVFIYNGNATLRLNNEEMTIESNAAATVKSMENNSYLYNSMAMLRNMIPSLMANDSFQRVLSDTVIEKKAYYNIRFEGTNKYFGLLGDVEHFTMAGLRRPYYLLIDKKTWLPFQLISKIIRGTDDRDFVTLTYTAINTRPEKPEQSSWGYAFYQTKYKPYTPPVKIPLVKPGTTLARFTLPSYTASGIDSISSGQLSGKIVLLDFWFKSCGPCMEAMPHYNDLQNQFKKEGFELLTINVEDPVEDIAYFYKKYQPVYKMMYNGNKLWSGLGFTGCPSSVLVDRNGKVVQAFFGFDEVMIGKKIRELVGKGE